MYGHGRIAQATVIQPTSSCIAPAALLGRVVRLNIHDDAVKYLLQLRITLQGVSETVLTQ